MKFLNEEKRGWLIGAAAVLTAFFGTPHWIGESGILGQGLGEAQGWVYFGALCSLWFLVGHITIVCMSLCYHRAHTHQAVKFRPVVDMAMQTWLWMFCSLSKLDWVPVHIVHHATSDTEKDPHSPVQNGIFHALFLGVFDYTKAKDWPEVDVYRKKMKTNAYERFIYRHLFLGPMILITGCLVLLGPVQGVIVSVLSFMVAPVFAIGGVNALCHWVGYKNYKTNDNSRNLGFLFFLNWIVSGELDHNNHHHYPKSPKFAHRWYEFDIGWVYIWVLSKMGLARVIGKIPSRKVEAFAKVDYRLQS